MRIAVTGLALLAGLGLAACANNPNRPTDTGNMAYPTPQPQGVIGTNRPGADVGNMAQPAPSGSVGLRPSPERNDTGSMAMPESTQGNLRRPSTRRSY
jgi:hypothetical protein